MKLAKMLGLAAVAALVAMAFVGVSSASATIPYLCNNAVLASCNETTTIYKADPDQEKGDQLEASLQPGTVAKLTGRFEVECEVSNVNAGLTVNPAAGQEEQIEGQIKTLTFDECKKGVSPCSAEAVNTPYSLHLEQAANNGDGVGWVGPQAGGQPGAVVTCGLQVCKFEANEEQEGEVSDSVKLSMIGNEGGSAANRVKMNLANVELKVTEGLPGPCGETATWDAEYEVTNAIVQQGTEEEEEIEDPPGWVTHD